MNLRIIMLLSFVCTVQFACGGILLARDSDREITISVTVENTAGERISQAPLAFSTNSDSAFRFTDENGMAEASVIAPGGNTIVDVRLWDGLYFQLDTKEAMLAGERYEYLRTEFAFRYIYRVPITATDTQSTKHIVVPPAVSVSGTLKLDTGEDIEAVVAARRTIGSAHALPGQAFVVNGIPKGQVSELVVIIHDEPQVHFLELDAGLTGGDAVLGQIVLHRDELSQDVNITLQDSQDLRGPDNEPLNWFVTAISDDADIVCVFPVDDGGIVRYSATQRESHPRLRSGRYFLSLGSMNDYSNALLNKVRAGDIAAVEAAGVPSILVAEDEVTTIAIEGPAAHAALQSLLNEQKD